MMQGRNQESINTVLFYESYESEDEFAIVMELCNKNMISLITQKVEPFSQNEIFNILCQLNNSFKIIVKNKIKEKLIKHY